MPAPPLMVSSPALPVKESLPLPPLRTFLPVLPTSVLATVALADALASPAPVRVIEVAGFAREKVNGVDELFAPVGTSTVKPLAATLIAEVEYDVLAWI